MSDIKWSMWSALDGDTDCWTQAYNCPIFLHLYYFMYSTQGGNLGPRFKKMRQYGSFQSVNYFSIPHTELLLGPVGNFLNKEENENLEKTFSQLF